MPFSLGDWARVVGVVLDLVGVVFLDGNGNLHLVPNRRFCKRLRKLISAEHYERGGQLLQSVVSMLTKMI